MTITWISSEEITVSPEVETMNNEELAIKFNELKDDNTRWENSEVGNKWMEVYNEVISEIERRYFLHVGIPEHFIRIIKSQGGIDWTGEGYTEQQIFSEMLEALTK